MTADIHLDVDDHEWNGIFSIGPNFPPTIESVLSHSLQSPDGIYWNLTTPFIEDPEGLTLTKSILFDGGPAPGWFNYDLETAEFSIITSNNDNAAVHNVLIIADDGINDPVYRNFTLTIIFNIGPQKHYTQSNVDVVNYNPLLIEFPPFDEVFTDPEDRPLTPNLTLANGDPAPSFMVLDTSTNTISGIPEFVHVGDWIMSYSATDDHGQKAEIVFTVVVKPCYFRCDNCTGEDYNQCTLCKDPYYLQFSQCITECSGSFYENPDTKLCEACHEYCTLCEDDSPYSCSECNDGYFSFENGCYFTCPDGYFGNTQTWTCDLCNPACTKCFGGSTTECTECNNDELFLLSGTECKLAQCIAGFYLNHTDLQ